jgi:uncharacterized protein (TIGR00251 family)
VGVVCVCVDYGDGEVLLWLVGWLGWSNPSEEWAVAIGFAGSATYFGYDAKPADLLAHFISVTCPLSYPTPTPSMSGPAIRFVASKSAKNCMGTIQLLCHVKPGVSARREGIVAVSDERIEMCVAAQPKDGEANKAVRQVIADALRVARSDVEVIKGMKSREKTVAVQADIKGTAEEEVTRIRTLLEGRV